MSNSTETSIPPDFLEIVRQLKELTTAGRLAWDESRTTQGHPLVAVSLASGRWQLVRSVRESILVDVWDDAGNSIFKSEIAHTDPNFAEIKDLHDTAVRKNHEQNTSRALARMREELAAR